MNQYVCTNRTENYKDRIERIINEKKQKVLDFFQAKDDGQFNYKIYIYDTIEELKEGLSERGFKKQPEYLCACFRDEDQTLNFYEPEEVVSETEWNKEEYDLVIYHELIHAIEYTLYGKQPEWLSEGIAKYLDGTYKHGAKWLIENYLNNQPVPEMKELIEEFGFHEYDSYDYAYITVCYLLETMGKERFLLLLKNAHEVTALSENLITRSIEHFKTAFSH